MGGACSAGKAGGGAKPHDHHLPAMTVVDPDRPNRFDSMDAETGGAVGAGPSPEALDALFTKFARNTAGKLAQPQLEKLMSKLRRNYEQNKPALVKRLAVPAYDAPFYALVLFALDDDEDGVIEIDEWRRWILRGATMDRRKREQWASKDADNQRLDMLLRSVVDAVGSSTLDSGGATNFDAW